MHLFAYNAPIQQFNKDELLKINGVNNPVARLIPKYCKTSNVAVKASSSHFDKRGEKICVSYIARGCKVELRGRNIAPQFGLYNGAMGIVKDIVYNENESPITGHMPRYVLVFFPSYTGPQFLLEEHNNVIPIVPVEGVCSYRCCKRFFIPLQLCYAKTIHKFQGQSAGPVALNQQPNPHQRIVINLGTRQFEGAHPGLTYTGLSRGTTLGLFDDISTSAVFFDGPDIYPARFTDISKSPTTGQEYKLVQMRSQWVTFLTNHTIVSGFSGIEIGGIFSWSLDFRPNTCVIQQFFDKFKHKS
jgi:hypothetical protein